VVIDENVLADGLASIAENFNRQQFERSLIGERIRLSKLQKAALVKEAVELGFPQDWEAKLDAAKAK
jgi:hypothetical protein